MSSPRITYTPSSDATPETELDALANVYRFVLGCHAKKEDGPTITAPKDALNGSKGERAQRNTERHRCISPDADPGCVGGCSGDER
jgi:hypothetical protein